jgi:hypothetical protein
MAQGSSGGALIAAALILGGSVVGASYLVATAIDRGAGQVTILNASLVTAMDTAKEIASAGGRPAARAGPKRPDPNKVYEVEIGSAPIRGPKTAAVTIVEWADFQ